MTRRSNDQLTVLNLYCVRSEDQLLIPIVRTIENLPPLQILPRAEINLPIRRNRRIINHRRRRRRSQWSQEANSQGGDGKTESRQASKTHGTFFFRR